MVYSSLWLKCRFQDILRGGRWLARSSGTRWFNKYSVLILAAVTCIGTLASGGAILHNLRAMEQNRINEYRNMALNLKVIVKDFILKEQYTDLQNLMQLLTQTQNIEFMAVYIGNECALQAGTDPQLGELLIVDGAPDAVNMVRYKGSLVLGAALPFSEKLQKNRHLMMSFSLREFEVRRKIIVLAMGIVGLLLLVILVMYFRLHRTQGRLIVLNASLENTQNELMVLNASLRQAQDKLRQEESTRTSMIDAIGHDALHYVTVIKDNINNQMDAVRKGVKAFRPEDPFQVLLENNESLTKLLENLKFHDYLKRGIVKNSPARLEWSGFLRTTLNNLKPLLDKKAIKVRLVVPPEELFAFVDRDLVKRVLINLLHNAFKFTREKSCLEVTLTREGEMLRTRIQDRGPGIPREDWERIFEPSIRLDNDEYVRPEDRRGTGLGLSNARQFVRMCGGEMGIESSSRELGTLVYFTLPGTTLEAEA